MNAICTIFLYYYACYKSGMIWLQNLIYLFFSNKTLLASQAIDDNIAYANLIVHDALLKKCMQPTNEVMWICMRSERHNVAALWTLLLFLNETQAFVMCRSPIVICKLHAFVK